MHFSSYAIWLSCTLLSVAVQAGKCASDIPNRASSLVEKLGSSRFVDREDANKSLLRLGAAALPALREGLKSDDLEVRRRCRRLIPSIEQAEWARKADAYGADRKGKGEYDLPLQKEYEKLVGTDPAACKLFADIVRTNGVFLQRVVEASDRGRGAFERRCQELFPSLKDNVKLNATMEKVGTVRPEDLAALLLVAAVFKVDQARNRHERCHVADLLGNAGVGEAMKDKKVGKAVSRLLVGWAESQSFEDSIALGCFFYFVYMEDFKEGLVVVRRVIWNKDNPRWRSAWLRAVGVAVLAKVGGEAVVKELEKLREDQTVLLHSPYKDNAEIRLGDQALAASMCRAGKDPKDYETVELPYPVFSPPGTEMWIVPVYGFISDKDRRKALKQWKDQRYPYPSCVKMLTP